MKQVDILLATYNGEKYLEELLKSLFRQTNHNFNILVRDDQSTDSTKKILDAYIQKYPNRVDVLEDNERLGSARSFMRLIEMSDAEYYMLCDQDDIWLPNKVELLFSEIREKEKQYGKETPILLFTDLVVVDEKLGEVSESFWRYQKIDPKISKDSVRLLAQNVITGCTTIMNKAVKSVVLPFDFCGGILHDQWLGVKVSGKGVIDHLDNQTVLYRQHTYNVAGAHSYDYRYAVAKILRISSLFRFFRRYRKCVENTSVFELVCWKIILNLKRFFYKGE